MNLFIQKSAIGIAIVAIASIGCTSPTQKVENAKSDLKEAKIELSESERDSITDYNNFMADANKSIAVNDRAIETYKVDMQTSSTSLRTSNQKNIDNLAQRNIDMRKKIESYNGRSDWDVFKKEFKYDMDKLSAAIKNVGIRNSK